MIHNLLLTLVLLLKCLAAYYVVIGLFALLPGKRTKPSPPKTRFAVLIAARNEARVIGRIIESLKRQHYPKALYDIYVIPNNCTDDTEAAATQAGAKLLLPDVPVRCKGDALSFACRALPEGYDAICVFDADNVVDSEFLSVCNRHFCAGAQVLKGSTEALNPYASWVSGCYAIYFKIMNLFYNRARCNARLSAKLVGTAFAVRTDLLRRIGGWHTETITEDCEFGVQLAIAGARVVWAPEAIAYDEQPEAFPLSCVQRRRWVSGILEVTRKHMSGLISGNCAPLQQLDTTMQLIYPILSPVSFVLGYAMMLADTPTMALASFLLSILGSMCSALFIALVCGLRDVRILKSVAAFPIFVLSWIPIQAISIFVRVKTWKPIGHGAPAELRPKTQI